MEVYLGINQVDLKQGAANLQYILSCPGLTHQVVTLELSNLGIILETQ